MEEQTNLPKLAKSPWDTKARAQIIYFQHSTFHPYTCPNHPERALYVGFEYLACNYPGCGYIQHDVLESIVDGTMNKQINEVNKIVEEFKAQQIDGQDKNI